LLLALIVFVLFFVRDPGFTLIVRAAPPGSVVFVDNVSRGHTSADGAIRVLGLKPGKRLVRVTHEGYEDFNSSVSGKDGEEKTVVAQLASTGARTSQEPPALPSEIDYNGPMILVPNGEFVMGDDFHRPEEKPTHKVTLADFYIDKFEVTNEQYRKFSEATGRPQPSNPWWDGGYLQNNPKAPVVGVSWNDAAAYAKWAGKRLPTEEEWEKAASWDVASQKKRQWAWGDSPDAGRASLGGASRPSDVGRFPSGASAYGVHDMSGNVAEWVSDYFKGYEGNTSSDPNFGKLHRVVRGGSFRSGIEDGRTTRRFFAPSEFSVAEKRERSWLIGFRCAITAADPTLQERLRAQTK
jgi:formylglycine-generating enzyme required for sulfatase activity